MSKKQDHNYKVEDKITTAHSVLQDVERRLIQGALKRGLNIENRQDMIAKLHWCIDAISLIPEPRK